MSALSRALVSSWGKKLGCRLLKGPRPALTLLAEGQNKTLRMSLAPCRGLDSCKGRPDGGLSKRFSLNLVEAGNN